MKAQRAKRRFTWSGLLWDLIFPRPRQRIAPTIPGTLLILLSLGVGMAAYNAGNNILFITLSLMLGCLILSGVLSWLNFRGLSWQLEIAPPLRVGQEAVASVRVANHKRFLPTYGLQFELTARAAFDENARAETTFSAKGIDVKAAMAAAEAAERGTLVQTTRIDAGRGAQLEWVFRPTQRGLVRVELESVGSLFPFGFLRKSIAVRVRENRVVWPAPVEYRRLPIMSARRPSGGERVARVGMGSDLLALRRYELGDSHRLIHWKASARTGKLLVRQFAAEAAEGFSLWVQSDGERWSRAEQFELLVSFAATLAEDLFRAEKLVSAAIDDTAPMPMRRVQDVEAFLDRLAVLRVQKTDTTRASDKTAIAGERRIRRRNVVTFAPEGAHGVVALLEGRRLAAA